MDQAQHLLSDLAVAQVDHVGSSVSDSGFWGQKLQRVRLVCANVYDVQQGLVVQQWIRLEWMLQHVVTRLG
jgi:hypothetical protein